MLEIIRMLKMFLMAGGLFYIQWHEKIVNPSTVYLKSLPTKIKKMLRQTLIGFFIGIFYVTDKVLLKSKSYEKEKAQTLVDAVLVILVGVFLSVVAFIVVLP